MANVGILVHARHLDTVGWERLMWGVPEKDSLGSLTIAVELLLTESKDEPVTTILFGSGHSRRDGLLEGEYAKRYLLRHIKQLREFPRFAGLEDAVLDTLVTRFASAIVTPEIVRSIDEITDSAELFAKRGVTKVLQVTSANHAPRCVQIQAAARAAGLIPKNQQWFLVADE